MNAGIFTQAVVALYNCGALQYDNAIVMGVMVDLTIHSKFNRITLTHITPITPHGITMTINLYDTDTSELTDVSIKNLCHAMAAHVNRNY